MIVPGNRLLWALALIGLPAVLIVSLLPGAAEVAWWVIALLGLVAVGDAFTTFNAFEGLEPVPDELNRLAKDRDSVVPIRLKNATKRAWQLRLGVAWPEAFESEEESVLVQLPEGAPVGRFDLHCLPRERGSFTLQNLYLERSSRLGFWAARTRLPLRMELRVFPDLRRDQAAAAIFLNRGLVGLHAQRQVGKGREFEKLRDYVPGDGYEDIHWKSTAKRGRPITKTYQIERTQEVYCLVDSSRLSARRAGEAGNDPNAPTMLERYVVAAMLFGAAAERQGDLFGLITFDDHVRHYIPAKNGKAHHDACRDAIYGLRPREVSPDFDELFTFLRTIVRKRALLIFLTSLDDDLIAETFVRNLPIIRRTHLTYTMMIDPEDVGPLFSRPVDSVGAMYAALAGHERWEHLRGVERALAVQGVRMTFTQSEQLVVALLNQYMEVKRRQLL